jgi:hypothetical protein
LNEDVLRAAGFSGFLTFRELRQDGGYATVPTSGGVYVVLRRDGQPPEFADVSAGGHFKRRDPTVPIGALEARWIDGATVLYVGKANALRRRLREFSEFGLGRPIGHWGGRLIWQLVDAPDLVLAWKTARPGEDPFTMEARWIHRFREEHGGRVPFANLASPRRSGHANAASSPP